MRRLLPILALTAACLLPTTAHAVVPQYVYKACNNYGQNHVCLKADIAQQADGQGWNVQSVSIYGYTDTANGCDGFNSGPAIYNYATDVWKTTAAGDHTGNPMHRTTPDLDNPTNGCFWKYTPGLVFNSVDIDVSFNFKARLILLHDPADTLWIHVHDNGTFGCGSADVCTRS